jgi:prophage antirepressor-like protein
MYIINESGLYTLIMRSDKPVAKRFRKWVTSEVRPAIRKTGSYAMAPAFAINTARQRHK